MTNSINRINFTKASIENLPIPESGWKYYYDTKVPGLAVGVGASGVKTFVLYKKINRRPERIKIGRVTDLTVDEARTKAIEHNGKVALGSNPADKKRQQRAEITFGEMFQLYYEQHSKPHKKTHKEDLAKFHRYLSDRKYGINLAKRRLSEISLGEIKVVFNKISEEHPITANRVLALISSVFSEAVRAELFVGLNPCRGVRRNKENKRSRFLTREELPNLFSALEECKNPVARDYIKMSLITGARRSNVLAMRWDQINFVRNEWLIPDTKNGEPQTIPLLPQALEVLKTRRSDPTAISSEFVFPGTGAKGHLVEPKRAWSTIRKRAGIEDVRLHDLRRTFGAWMAGSGANLSVIGKSLNHKSLDTTKTYDRLWIDPVREAMEKAVGSIFTAAGST
ncbi:site-specific integrase [Comamonas aquatica]|uniref:tyrosine-type recombinase/integrase n=1 Tax=Comamonas aquatica TaxID=225991 RepID=UPI002446800E|nr:site-specific integrase [Comamonas aquatica]MDH0373508.1 site-specific integrase [Comamonas aquatica]